MWEFCISSIAVVATTIVAWWKGWKILNWALMIVGLWHGGHHSVEDHVHTKSSTCAHGHVPRLDIQLLTPVGSTSVHFHSSKYRRLQPSLVWFFRQYQYNFMQQPQICVQGVYRVAILVVLAGTFSACSADSTASANVSASTANGSQVNVTHTGNEAGSGTTNRQTRTNTRASTADTFAVNSTDMTLDIVAIRRPPVTSEAVTDPTSGMRAPPAMSHPSPEPEGVVLRCHRLYYIPAFSVHAQAQRSCVVLPSLQLPTVLVTAYGIATCGVAASFKLIQMFAHFLLP